MLWPQCYAIVTGYVSFRCLRRSMLRRGSPCYRLQSFAEEVDSVVTLADVARLSATSRSTASRALNADPRISSATTERVRLVAEALGYRPNIAARSLSTGRSGIIGLILPTGQLTGDP